jgi:hypothetical protein
MVDTSYERYASLALGFGKQLTRSPVNWYGLGDAQRESIIAGRIQELVGKFGDEWERHVPDLSHLTYEAAGKLYEESGDGVEPWSVTMNKKYWNSMTIDERLLCIDKWRDMILVDNKADTPDTEITAW